MNASLSLEQLKEFSKKMQVEAPFTAVDTDENVLLFLFMTEESKKVDILKNSKSIATEVQYIKQIDAFVVWIVPSEFIEDFSLRSNVPDYAVCGLVRVDDKRAFQTLKDISDNKATAQLYTFDKELKNISIKPIFTSEMSRVVIEREINKSGK